MNPYRIPPSPLGVSSRISRVVAVLAACVVTATLFSAVAVGLTGEDPWSLLAQGDKAADALLVHAA